MISVGDEIIVIGPQTGINVPQLPWNSYRNRYLHRSAIVTAVFFSEISGCIYYNLNISGGLWFHESWVSPIPESDDNIELIDLHDLW